VQRTFGMQLEAVRTALAKDPDPTLKAIASAGYTEVEGYGRRETLALLSNIRQSGLTVRSCVMEAPLITTDWENYPDFKPLPLPEAIDGMKAAGIEYCAMGAISPGARGDGDDFFRRTADRMNAAGELCRKAGMKFVWPNQAFEFEGKPGGRPIDIYHDRLDPKLVAFEMDVFWVSVAKHDPVELLKEWKGRVPVMRLRDKLKDSFAAIGEGEINFAAILKAAQAAGTKDYFVYDDSGNFGKALSYLKKA
jgi:sugar phosphate isomerase/epimerase